MLDEISEEQFLEWMAYYTLEPFGPLQGFLQAGIISATMVNANPFRSKGSKSASPLDFVPNFIPEKFREKQKRKNIMESLKALATPGATLEEYERQRRARKQAAKRRKRKIRKEVRE